MTRLTTLVVLSLMVAFPRHCLAQQPAQSRIKNVLFIISDDLKASVLGCYGDTVCHTPNIDALARTGVVFDRAYCQGVWCAPSRESFMFSRYEGAGSVNLGEHFRDNGWYTARVGKIFHMAVPGDIIAGTNGRDVESAWTKRYNSQGQEAHTPGHYACLNQNVFTTEARDRQSTRMPHRMFVTVRYEGDGSDQPDHKSATKAVELLRQHKDKPFLLAVGLVRPHYPMVAPQQYFDRYPWQDIVMPQTVKNDLDDIPKMGIAKAQSATNPIGEYPDNQKRMWAGYYASVEFMDHQVGRVIDELDRLGLRENTAIIFTSDHGYHLGEHSFWLKMNLHEEVTRVPLVISAPGFPTGRTESIAELVDIYPTISRLVGIDIPNDVQGTSLVPILLNNHAKVKQAALSLYRGGYAVRSQDWAYIRYADSTTELYDMNADPKQFTNLTQHSDFTSKRNQMDNELNGRLMAIGVGDQGTVR